MRWRRLPPGLFVIFGRFTISSRWLRVTPTKTNELVSRGFNRWVKTWIADYASVEEIYWNVPGDKIDPEKLPSRAIDGPKKTAQRDETLAVIADYNLSQDMTPELDARFGNLAGIAFAPIPFATTL